MKIAMIGYGNVGTALVRLLSEIDKQGKQYVFTSIITRKMGIVDLGGSPAMLVDKRLKDAIGSSGLPKPGAESKEVISWLKEGDYDILVEATHCNYADAEPAISYIRTVLSQGKDVATANKAPIALGLRELKELSDGKEALLRFESTVMDGTPIFSVFRDALPKLRILRIRGILNSTANIVLDYLHQGKSVSEGLRYSQSRGIAETDPSLDLGGHDAAAKLIILSNALNNTDIKFEDVSIQSVTESNYEMTKNLARDSQAYIVRQISVADFESHIFKVGLERVVDNDPLYACRGSSNSVSFNTDIYTELIISGNNPTLRDTAFGIYSDLESIRSCRMRSK